jgi:hypothetical protein
MSTAKRGRRADRDNKAGSEAHGEFLCSMIRNYTRQVRAGELDADAGLTHMARLRRELEEQTALMVLELRSQGQTWDQIGTALGMTRHAAYTKYVGRARVDSLFSDENTGSPARVGAVS